MKIRDLYLKDFSDVLSFERAAVAARREGNYVRLYLNIGDLNDYGQECVKDGGIDRASLYHIKGSSRYATVADQVIFVDGDSETVLKDRGIISPL